MSFQEKDLEELIFGLLSDIEGFEYVHGDNLERALDNVLLEADLRNFLAEKYKEDAITESEIEKIILSLKAVSSASVYDANKTIFRKIVEGENFIRDDSTQKDFWLKLIDFDHIENNIVREDIKAELWCDIIVLLGNNGFPPIPLKENPEDYTQVYKDVLEQAENFKKYYSN